MTEELKDVDWERTYGCKKSAGADRELTNNINRLTERLSKVSGADGGADRRHRGTDRGAARGQQGRKRADRNHRGTDRGPIRC